MRSMILKQLRAAESATNTTLLQMLRLISTAISDKDNAARLAGLPDGVSDEAIRRVIDTMIQQRKKSVLNYEEQGRLDLADNERKEIAVLTGLLPLQLCQEDIRRAVVEAIKNTGSTGIRHKGRVMSELKSRFPGQMDFKAAGRCVEELLR